MTIRETTLLLVAFLLILVAYGVTASLITDATHHCEIDAPMEQSQCRAEEGL